MVPLSFLTFVFCHTQHLVEAKVMIVISAVVISFASGTQNLFCRFVHGTEIIVLTMSLA